MKKLIATLTPCIIACLLLSSCGGSRVSIAKRHYRGGYYVDYTKRAPTTTRTANEPTKTNSSHRVTIASLPSPEPQNFIKRTFIPSNQPISFETVAIPENMQRKNAHQAMKQLLSLPAGITKAPATEVKQSLSEGSIGSAGDGDAAGAALSLLWIIIVIILIIWLIGILAGGWGLGGLLNLLLVIALILLILWLLRIA